MTEKGRYVQLVSGSCELCGTAFTKKSRGKPYRFCSRACGVRGRSGASRRAKIERKCVTCGKAYEVKPKNAAHSKFCSMRCMGRANKWRYAGAKNPNFRAIPPRVCEGCHGFYFSYTKTRRFCSVLCGQHAQGAQALGNQRRGYETELKVCEELDRLGFLTFRSAASRGPFDVIGMGKGGTYWIQVKRTKTESRKKFPSVVCELHALSLPEKHHAQIWVWVDRKGFYIIHLNRDGTTEEWWSRDRGDFMRVAGVAGFQVDEPGLDIEMRLE